MFIINEDRRIVGDLAGHIARLEALVADLERFANGDLPSSQELEAAPLISPFTVAARASACLIGGNNGHPYLKGPVIRTSEVWVMAPTFGWARTFSRVYRLGEPLNVGTNPASVGGGQ